MHTRTIRTRRTHTPLEKQYKFVMSKNLQFWNINERSTQPDVDELAKFWHSSRGASHLLPSLPSPSPLLSPFFSPHFRLFPLNPFFLQLSHVAVAVQEMETAAASRHSHRGHSTYLSLSLFLFRFPPSPFLPLAPPHRPSHRSSPSLSLPTFLLRRSFPSRVLGVAHL